jgi:hypothetical protein
MTKKSSFMDGEVEFANAAKLIVFETRGLYNKPFCLSIFTTAAENWDSCCVTINKLKLMLYQDFTFCNDQVQESAENEIFGETSPLTPKISGPFW